MTEGVSQWSAKSRNAGIVGTSWDTKGVRLEWCSDRILSNDDIYSTMSYHHIIITEEEYNQSLPPSAIFESRGRCWEKAIMMLDRKDGHSLASGCCRAETLIAQRWWNRLCSTACWSHDQTGTTHVQKEQKQVECRESDERSKRRGNSDSSAFHCTSSCDCGAHHGRKGAAGLN